ncbi:hypothetical protein DY037_05480 [Apilactobacillus micheneri]|uniref:hypothetical protein n=1 Tax=Apilactobacillus micheneri TaxID=1899430 RepID=UPI001125DDC6|nr:hypothetical protein [Apilactobacillus micheneri]TPR49232.1 hypothetical protein DY037_05480 [Apilactobacillus micheneri]
MNSDEDNKKNKDSFNQNQEHLKDRQNQDPSASSSPDNDFADTNTEDGSELSNNKLLRSMQKAVIPYRKKVRKFTFYFKDSMRVQRLSIVGILLMTMFSSLILAQCTSKGFIIKSTPINSSRSFLNGDTAKIRNVTYDSNSQSAMINLTTNSNSGILNQKDIKAKFILMQAPSHQVKAPTLNLMSTYGNHFTILVKNLYKGFGAFKLILVNNRQTSLSDFAKALNNGSNSQTSTPLTSSQVKTVISYKSGNKKANDGTNLQGNVNINDGSHFKKAQSLLKTMQSNNTTKFILTEKTINKFKGKISSQATPKGIMEDNLNTTIDNLQSDIKTKEKEISDNNQSIKDIKKQIDHEYSDRLNSSKNNQIKSLNSNIENIKSTTIDAQNKIKLDNKYIKQYRNKLELIKKGTVVMDDNVKPQKASLFQP